jgi:ankyrin repeat protein
MNKNGDREGMPLYESPFNYAVSYWLPHAMGVPQGCEGTSISRELWELVRDFFWDEDGALFTEWLRVFVPNDEDWHKTKVFRCLSHYSAKSVADNSIVVAASYGLIDILEWAHPDGIDFNVSDASGVTPLQHTAWCGEEDAAKVLLAKNSVRVNQAVCRRSSTGQCLEGDCRLNGHTPLMGAVIYGYPNMVKLLLRQPGIEVDLVSHGNTALGHAIREFNTKGIELLVGAGAKLAMYGGKIMNIPSHS